MFGATKSAFLDLDQLGHGIGRRRAAALGVHHCPVEADAGDAPRERPVWMESGVSGKVRIFTYDKLFSPM